MVDEKKDQAETTNLMFAINYNHYYRYYKHVLLMNNFDNIEKLVSDLSNGQYENLRQMIEIEILVNAIQYCNDLGAIAICVKKRRIKELGYMLSSIKDESITDFYKSIMNEKYKNVKKYMGYHDIDTENYKNLKYLRSCDRYIDDVSRLSKFYLFNYDLYLSHKHGLRIAPMGSKDGRSMFFYANDSGALGCYFIPEFKGVINSIEVCDIIKNIFEKLYIPLIRKTMLEFLDLDADSELPLEKSIETEGNLIPNPTIRFNVSYTNPWWNQKNISDEHFY